VLESADLVEQRVEDDIIAESEVPTIADAASNFLSDFARISKKMTKSGVAVVPKQSDELRSATITQQPSSQGMVKQKRTQPSLAFRCKISPIVKCTMHTFL
jgi:hypothetical protein